MIGTTKRVAICAALLALGGMTAACGDDDDGGGSDAGRADAGRDSGTTGDMDSGTDGGGDTGDAGSDAGTPRPYIRLAHLIPGGPPVHVCIHADGVPGTLALITRNTMMSPPPPQAVPYPGVSNYTNALPLLSLPYTVRVYNAADINEAAAQPCPAETATTPTPLITTEIDVSTDLTPGAYHTVAAIGLPGGAGAQAPQLIISVDDLSDPAAGKARVRLFHAVPNLPGNVDVCYDADGAGAGEPTRIFDDVAFSDVEDYIEIDPTPAGATFAVHIHNAAAPACAEATRALGPIPVPLPVPATPANLQSSFDEGEVITVFAAGRAAPLVQPADGSCADADECAGLNPTLPAAALVCNAAMRCQDRLGPTVIPWQDNLGI
ncbi:DUF4397 domain-containing protein [Sandaracinus amylolyticus]|uniref:DUF4397 domain-containing protein n=1 Tax=Sandaracinus amylolyticus TaxID=927083 RepID=A0A0F6W5G4_9BACT|nr:DUF4397 domain-containing protein [Sandaracinus amylolyticus]AKF07943.1 hypothetical protein DB32_005092 [Sandaracinus amylolyticus]